MKLVHLAAGLAPVPLARIGADPDLAEDIQAQLAAAGLLDPPADRLFGPVSHWALAEFLVHWGLADACAIDMQVASALLQADASFPLVAGNDVAGDVVRAMQAAGHWICRHPRACNIVYVEGLGLDGTPSRDPAFGDARLLLRVDEHGRPQLAGAWEGSLGAFGPDALRIACGQYKAWNVGQYPGEMPYEALVQTAPVQAHSGRGAELSGLFGLHQHCADDLRPARTSAGGAVGRSKSGHREFMALAKGDPRFLANKGYRFMATVLPLAALWD
jgi:hypothetical protein